MDKDGKIGHDPQTRHNTTRKQEVMGWGLMGSCHVRVDTTNPFNKRVELMFNT